MANRLLKYNSQSDYEAAKGSLLIPYVAIYPSTTDGKTVVVYANADGTNQSEVIATAQLTNLINTLSEETNTKLADLDNNISELSNAQKGILIGSSIFSADTVMKNSIIFNNDRLSVGDKIAYCFTLTSDSGAIVLCDSNDSIISDFIGSQGGNRAGDIMQGIIDIPEGFSYCKVINWADIKNVSVCKISTDSIVNQISNLVSNNKIFSVKDCYLLSNSGNIAQYHGYNTTDFIAIGNTSDIVIINASTDDGGAYCFYDRNKSYIRGERGIGTCVIKHYDIPTNAAYIRISTISSRNTIVRVCDVEQLGTRLAAIETKVDNSMTQYVYGRLLYIADNISKNSILFDKTILGNSKKLYYKFKSQYNSGAIVAVNDEGSVISPFYGNQGELPAGSICKGFIDIPYNFNALKVINWNDISEVEIYGVDTDSVAYKADDAHSNSNIFSLQGKYLNSSSGTLSNHASYRCTDFIAIGREKDIYINNASTDAGGAYCLYDKNFNYISGKQNFGSIYIKSSELPIEVAYIRISTTLSSNIQVSLCSLENLGARLADCVKKSRGHLQNNAVVVGESSELYNFTDINEAIISANGKPVFVDNGSFLTHVKDLTTDKIIIGVDKDVVKVYNNDSSYENPPIEIAGGIIKNISITADTTETEATHLGYCIHSDKDQCLGKTLIIENCRLTSDNANSCVGIGLYFGEHVIFKNCEFISNKATGVYIHNGGHGTSGNARVTFDNCIFRCEKRCLHLQHWPNECGVDYEFFNNTFISNGQEANVLVEYIITWDDDPANRVIENKFMGTMRLSLASHGNNVEFPTN